jgi:hypothetical protein
MPTYPVLHAVMNSHLVACRGHPQGAVDANGYLSWLAGEVNPRGSENRIDAVRKWFRGASRPYANKLPRLYRALRLIASPDAGPDPNLSESQRQHLMWELQLCVVSPDVTVSWYSAEFDAQRLQLRTNPAFRDHVAPYIPARVDPPANPQAAVQANAQALPAEAVDAPRAQKERAERLLSHPQARELLEALRRQHDAGAAPNARSLIDSLRSRTRGKAAMKAVVAAVKDLHQTGVSLTPAALDRTCRAATQLFVLFLGDFAAQPTGDSDGASVAGRLAFVRTDNPLAAALLAECNHLAGELRFVYLAGRPDGALVGLPYYLCADDPGISPGFGVQAHKADLAARICRELPRTAPGNEVPNWNDGTLAGLVENLADLDDVHFRFLVDLSIPSGATRLDVARQLNRDIGIAVVAYGDEPARLPDLVHCGSVRPESGYIDTLLVMLLSALHVLRSR